MFFREDTTYNDIRDRSVAQWLEEMAVHEDIAVRGGVRLTGDYIAYLKHQIELLQQSNELKNDHLKKMKQKLIEAKNYE